MSEKDRDKGRKRETEKERGREREREKRTERGTRGEAFSPLCLEPVALPS